jgi:hypothetical protein
MSDWCRACGHDTILKTREKKDVHGHILSFCEWTICPNCDLTKVVTPWMHLACPTPRSSSNC